MNRSTSALVILTGGLQILALALAAEGATIRVPARRPTIQAGIDAASSGDTVLVAAGTYSGPGNRDLDFNGRDIVVRSESGPYTTIIDCERAGRGFYLHSGETQDAIIEGFTVTHGLAPGLSSPDIDGGAVFLMDASPTIRHCIFRASIGYHGGGVAIYYSEATIAHSVITENRSEHGGGGIYCQASFVTIKSSEFSHNIAGTTDAGSGGGILSRDAVLLLADCMFLRNRAESWGDDMNPWAEGGGVHATGAVRLRDCSFIANAALAYNDNGVFGNVTGGGGAALFGDNVVVDSCVFRDNEARSSSGPKASSTDTNEALGGGLLCESATISNCIFERNVALSYGNPNGNDAAGGGLYSEDAEVTICLFAENAAQAKAPATFTGKGGGAASTPGSSFLHCTFTRNQATTSGAGIHLRGSGVTKIKKTIIAFSTASEAVSCTGGSSPVLSCSNVFGNAGGDWVGCISGQSGARGNFSADPLFCDPRNGDYTLHVSSPCAPDNSRSACGLIGARPVGCGKYSFPALSPSLSSQSIRVSPNPVSDRARVQWTDPVGGRRTVRLYDVEGRLVVSRDLGDCEPGSHDLAWEELTGDTSLPGGIYFLRFEGTSQRSQAVRVVVIR